MVLLLIPFCCPRSMPFLCPLEFIKCIFSQNQAIHLKKQLIEKSTRKQTPWFYLFLIGVMTVYRISNNIQQEIWTGNRTNILCLRFKRILIFVYSNKQNWIVFHLIGGIFSLIKRFYVLLTVAPNSHRFGFNVWFPDENGYLFDFNVYCMPIDHLSR